MITDATKEILYMVDEVEERKKSMESALKNLQNQKDKRRFKMFRNELILNSMELSPGLESTYRFQEFQKNSRIFLELNHKIAQQKKRFARASRAVGETLHWASLSEYRNKRDRRKAVELAKESAEI